jgi:XTP/dITP diphosphohydrolase
MTLADDSGLEVDYLDKAPGIYSARFLGEDTSYDVKNRYIIDKLADAKDEERSARFVCAICCAKPDGTSFTTRGTIEGQIGYEIAGENGFGYDPIFYLPEYGKTTAELSPEQKNAISHRGRALTQMKLKLDEIYG